jgi:electron transfer flavoprotein beta subunit
MAVKRAMGMGADRGIHVMARESGARDSLWVSAAIAEIARQENPGLIFTGVMARDDMQGLVGPMIAEMLGWPCATSTILEVLDRDQGTIYVEREIEGGYRHCLELSLPAVLTIQTGINQPRYPSLSNIMRAKKQELEVIRSASPDLPHSREAVLRVSHPQKTRDALVLEGDQTEKAVRLLGMLREKSLI